ncbi:L-asparaginase type I family protein [Sporocytophaga myxococcoides]|uniref:asparaginase n=2 Tax=Sporocytophaga myxococcoides TaxID=153721 RepID=A0A098LFR9_9BACT|nr:L-asparaginase type I family protein [Sporocytophaga myxococcoides]
MLIIYTGGTMGMHYDPMVRSLVPFDFSDIISTLPELGRFNLTLELISFVKPIDSSNMKPSHWIALVELIYQQYQEYDGFVILHGTDTMAYTASAVSFMMENLNKPVIFTGAQLPLSEVRSDARENLVTAIEIAAARKNGKPIVKEVCIYFNHALMRGNRSKKLQSSHFDAFLSENYPNLAEAGISIEFNEAVLYSPPDKPFRIYTKLDSNVLIVKLFPGITKEVVECLFNTSGLKGVVLETFGSGNAPTDAWLEDILKNASKKGIVVLNVSQCIGGTVFQGRYDTSRHLEKSGVISGKNITTEAAITKMMFVLANKPFSENVKASLEDSMRGEMD